jgi:L,D-transpeptidase ErfK/SrfK
MISTVHARLPGLASLLAALSVAAADPVQLPETVGTPSTTRVQPGDTLLDIAFRHAIGFSHLRRLNPDADVWIPEPGTLVHLPTEFIPPRAEPEGVVINVPEMRLYDFTAPGAPAVFPIAIGDAIDPTPLGEFRIGGKRIDPVWNVPQSIQIERPELPRQVLPGPENPLGDRWMRIGITSYGIHGTNKRWSIGRMATHGCVRLHNDQMRELFERAPAGTRVQLVYEPVKIGRKGRWIVLEAYPDVYAHVHDPLSRALLRLLALGLYRAVDPEFVRRIIEEARGVPVPIGLLPAERPPDAATS